MASTRCKRLGTGTSSDWQSPHGLQHILAQGFVCCEGALQNAAGACRGGILTIVSRRAMTTVLRHRLGMSWPRRGCLLLLCAGRGEPMGPKALLLWHREPVAQASLRVSFGNWFVFRSARRPGAQGLQSQCVPGRTVDCATETRSTYLGTSALLELYGVSSVELNARVSPDYKPSETTRNRCRPRFF